MLRAHSMARYETYQSNAAEAPIMRKWVLWALVISLCLHAALFVTFKLKKLENFGNVEAPMSPPIPINMKRPVIPMMDEKETPAALPKPSPNLAPLQAPVDKPEVQDIRVAPQLSELTKPLQGDKPRVDMAGMDALLKAEQKSRGDMDRELNSLAGALIKDSVRSSRQPVLKLPGGRPGDGGAGTAEGIAGLPSISDLLGEPGSLKSGARGGIPGGALYEHGQAELRADAVRQLEQLGELIRRNPNATFVIEGHADSTGRPEVNQELSQKRAQSVKNWLVAKMGIPPERIETIGLGSSKLIVPTQAFDVSDPVAYDAEIVRQAPNRRVEIVIKLNRK